MTRGTLIVSRSINYLQHYKKRLENFGFINVSYTSEEKDGLNLFISEYKPSLLMIEACFYDRATPYMMRLLLDVFPKLYIAVVNIYNYPDDTAMRFIFNGVKSYINMFEGEKEFEKGLRYIKEGKIYISPHIQEKINLLEELPEPSDRVTMRLNEVIRLVSCGFNDYEIADLIHITTRTVRTHKATAYKIFNVNNPVSLFWAAENAGLVTIDECRYFQKNYKPKTIKKRSKNDI